MQKIVSVAQTKMKKGGDYLIKSWEADLLVPEIKSWCCCLFLVQLCRYITAVLTLWSCSNRSVILFHRLITMCIMLAVPNMWWKWTYEKDTGRYHWLLWQKRYIMTPVFLQYRVLPFGIRNIPATFQRLVNTLLSGLSGCEADLGDIIVYSDTWKGHIQQLWAVFSRLHAANLTLVRKCLDRL